MLFYCSFLTVCSSTFAFDYGDPSILEQAHLESINRARANPLQEAKRLGINLFEGLPANSKVTSDPKQPLSFNSQLQIAAHNQSLDMLNKNYFGHTNSANQDPFDRFNAINYDYLLVTENIAMNGVTSTINDIEITQVLHNDLFIDKDYPNRSHRSNLLHPDLREIGIGLAFGAWHEQGKSFNTAMASTVFGTRKSDLPMILGVAYNDTNGNHFYDAGEGIPNINIAISGNQSTQTASAGGYGLEVTQFREYVLTFSHPNLGTINKTVRVDNQNIKVDVLLSEFPTSNRLSQRNNSGISIHSCLNLNEKKLNIPCINIAGSAFQVELEELDNPNIKSRQFSIHSILPTDLSTATSCEFFDPQTMKAYLRCINMNHQDYRVEMTLKPSATPLLELQLFNDMIYAY